jgi:dynein heavy chain
MKAYAEYQIKILEEESNNRNKILSEIPMDIKQYEELFISLSETPNFILNKKAELGKISDIIEIIENNYLSSEPIASGLRTSWKIPFMIQDKYRKGNDNLETKKIDFTAEVNKMKMNLKVSVKKIDEKFDEIRKNDNIHAQKFCYIVNDFNVSLLEQIDTKNDIKERMKILQPDKKEAIDNGEEDIPEFEKLANIESDFKNIKRIWDEVAEIIEPYDQNLIKPYSELKDNLGAVPDKKEQMAVETFSYIIRLDASKQVIDEITKTNTSEIALIKLCSSLKDKIKEYDSYSWIVSNLNSVHLRDEDWKEIKNMTGINNINSNISLKELKAQNIDDFKAEIESIKSRAYRRFLFNIELKNLIGEFNKIVMEYINKNGKVLLKGIDDIQITLDEQSNKLLHIFSNPVTQSDYRLKNETKNHNEKIKNLQNILEEILKFQSSHLYLEPIFSGGEVNKALSAEKSDFGKVNNFWKTILENLENSGYCLTDFMEKDTSSNLHKNLVENNKLLADIIQRLNDYLNTKRKSFPRFYFVSDEDLMKILAQTKDPTLIQAHLSKCFEGINKVVFDDTNSNILSMLSGGGELVKLKKPICVDDEVVKGNVEIWLGFLEDSMRLTMEKIHKESLMDFHKKKRIDWIQAEWPGQIVQTVDQIIWTTECENSLRNPEKGGLKQYNKRMQEDLNDIVELVRTPISKSVSMTLSGLIVISVHNKEIVESMIENRVTSDREFEWISQMRYYWSETFAKGETKCPLKIKMVTSCLNYGFEYLGNITRLVITPLTDRCFRTLFGAYQVKFGGAPEGPAGTGKTESVKDLAKCVGVMCNVFNCTEGLKTSGMSKFFKGLASSGVWCCFDEFNRIDTEVLSVIAQQILTIQNALKAHRTQFIFEDAEEIVLKDTCAMNITMNPSYSGRNDLPDNLKALFRPCAMMVADYNLISQIRLYSFGFFTAKVLANKVVSSLKLSSEQLSTQSHYDFGMRALNAILLAAGKLKKKYPDLDEDRITLRALVDVNIPKFTVNDIPLFNGIIGDLFPSTTILETDLSLLYNQLEASAEKFNLQPNPNFIKKCIQLYETMNVRHALMIVGRPGLGKTKVIETLKDSYKALKGNPGFGHVECNIMNPKSILLKQLYGYIDISTQEWKKGILQVKMSELCEKEKDVYKWLIFDGPVDTLWIENMNSLLDDNKKLCLEDSSSIMLGENMNILFEVDDLKEASPATVSRNGMVLCEADTISISNLITSYKNKLPKVFTAKFLKHFNEITFWFINTIMEFIFKNCQFGITMDRHHLTKAFLDIFECFLKEYRVKEENHETLIPKHLEMTLEKLDNLLIFSAILALTSPIKRHPKFQEFFYDLLIGNDVNTKYELKIPEWSFKKLTPKIHEIDDIFDVRYDLATNKWQKWNEISRPFTPREDMKYSELVVPTSENIKLTYMMTLTIPSKKHLLVTGNTGTGKTLTIINTLMSNYENEHYTYIKMNLTAQTSANQTQAIIEGKLQKSYRKFSPSQSRKGIIFIDDLNMPAKEKYGAQPPIELLRQWMDYNGWFDLNSDTKDFINIIDVSFLSAMGSVATGRTVSSRYLRHYILIYSENYSNQTLNKIFSNTMDWFFIKNRNPIFHDSIISLKDKVINATLQMYLNCNNQFKATPAKIHYTYNLRDVSRVFQGITKANSNTIKDDNTFIKLWIHECDRVFKDRLINEKDISAYETIITNVIKQTFRRDYSGYNNKQNPIIFGNYIPMIYPDNDESKPALLNQYCELSDPVKLKKTLENLLTEYNDEIGCKSESMGILSLVLFPYAIHHLSKILRIISTSNGNALLVGVGGSGRKSLTILASFINGNTMMTIDNSNELAFKDWKEQIKAILMEPLTGKEIVYMLGDAQMGNITYVEDINNMLNNGEIPNLIESQEYQNIKDNLPNEYTSKKIQTESEINSAFVELCKDKIHIIMCMSPIGETFRKRIMMFPSMVNCTTVDWFLPWPEEALSAVADFYLSELKLEDRYFKEIIGICVDMQSRVISYSEKFYQELRRHYYVTPMSFIELLNLFKNLLKKRSKEMNDEIVRYEKGLEIIEDSEKIAHELAGLIEKKLKPEIAEKKKECAEKIKVLEKLNEELKIKEDEGQKAEQDGMQKEKSAREKSESASNKLAEIKACKDDAESRLANIKQDEVMQLQKSKQDKFVSEFARFLCLLMMENPHPKPLKAANPKDPPTVDYFAHAQKIFGKGSFLKDFKNFNYEKMPQSNMEECRKELDESQFQPEQKSLALKNLFDIIRIYNKAYFINLEYIPTKHVAEESRKAFEESQESLKVIRDNLASLRKFKQEKEDEKHAAEKLIEELQKQLIKCETRQKNSGKLLGALENEKKEWARKKEELIKNRVGILGDILISSGIIAYLGAFTKSYREEIITTWSDLIHKANIPISRNDSPFVIMQRILGDKMEIENWKMKKLPNDSFSVDNALIITKSTRWPLLIDPQGQAVEWISETYNIKDRDYDYNRKKGQQVELPFHVIRPTMDQRDIVKTVTKCLKNGFTLLYENVGETLLSVLAPVYKKEYVKEGPITYVNINKNKTEVDPNFKFFISTKLPKPHYLPEICVSLTLVNFTVTEDGMEDQMLNFVVEKEDPQTEKMRKECIETINNSNKKRREIESTILELLYGSSKSTDKDTNILDNQELIQTLEISKQKSMEMETQLIKTAEAEEIIKKKRQIYRNVSIHVAHIFFTISDLCNIEPVYQYSLNWYKDIFNMAILQTQSQVITDKTKRLDILKENFTSLLYDKVCMSLFEKDKLVFSFLLNMKIKLISLPPESQLTYNKENRFLVTAGSGKETHEVNPAKSEEREDIWLSHSAWNSINELMEISEKYKPLGHCFVEKYEDWKRIFSSNDPINESYPEPFENLNIFEKLIIMRVVRPDKTIPVLKTMISTSLGNIKYVTSPPFDINKAYSESKNTIPIFFILSPGADPIVIIENLAKKLNRCWMDDVISLSLGQGQEEIATNNIEMGKAQGKWIILQNCHLARSFMETLEKLIDAISYEENSQFRLFLTGMPSKVLPISIIQNSIKLTQEPPRGLRQSILRSYGSFDDKFYESCKMGYKFKRFIYNLCFFHALILERRKFGPLGWNVPYEFSGGDLAISRSQIHVFLENYDEIQWDALNYMVAQANYGGRVTDPADRRLIDIIYRDLCNPKIIDDKFKIFGLDNYVIPPDGTHEEHIKYIETIPTIDVPAIFGLHENADITCAINETNNVFANIMLTLPRIGN